MAEGGVFGGRNIRGRVKDPGMDHFIALPRNIFQA